MSRRIEIFLCASSEEQLDADAVKVSDFIHHPYVPFDEPEMQAIRTAALTRIQDVLKDGRNGARRIFGGIEGLPAQ